MKATQKNPSTNKLGSGVSESKIKAVISKSGYPLQTRVADFLRQQFNVQEEWSYVDRDTQELRAIDILAEKWLFDFRTEKLRVRPTLDLIIECKKSTLPYVFFLSSSKPWVPYFPLLAGLFKHEINITTDDDPSSWTFRIPYAFGLSSHQFIRKHPEYCMSFTKCVHKGKNLEFSGSEAFHGVILPILKAMRHFQIAESPPRTTMYFDLHLVIGIGLLKAPMVGVRVYKNSYRLKLLPWVRSVRHETDKVPDWLSSTKLYAVDIVHEDFFEEYLTNHLLPYAENFSKLIKKHQQVLATGKAFVRGMEKDSLQYIEQRLEPRKMVAKLSRLKAALVNLLRFLVRRET